MSDQTESVHKDEAMLSKDTSACAVEASTVHVSTVSSGDIPSDSESLDEG